MFVLFFYLFLVTLLLFACSSILRSVWFDAPFVPTGRRDLRSILELANIKPGEIVYDLGSGDGRLVRAAARQGARAIGVEKLWILALWSRLAWWICTRCRALSAPVLGNGGGNGDGTAIFKSINFYKQDIRDADVVFCYLLPKAMENLKEKFEKELRPGARVISRAFSIHGWQPTRTLRFRKHSPLVYFYVRD